MHTARELNSAHPDYDYSEHARRGVPAEGRQRLPRGPAQVLRVLEPAGGLDAGPGTGPVDSVERDAHPFTHSPYSHPLEACPAHLTSHNPGRE